MDAAILGSQTTEHETVKDAANLRPLHSLARATGLMYLVLFALAMFGPLTLENLVEKGDGPATMQNLSDSLGLFGASIGAWIIIVAIDVALSVTLYRLLETSGKTMASLTAAFRLAYTAMLAAFALKLVDAFTILNGADRIAGGDSQQAVLSAVESFGNGFLLALVLFGVHLVLLGIALGRSRLVPGAIGFLLAIAGIGYIFDSTAHLFFTGHSETTSILLLTPAIIGEAGLGLWLLFRGLRTEKTVGQ